VYCIRYVTYTYYIRNGIEELNILSIKQENYQRIRTHLFQLMGYTCKHCGSIESLEFDHIVPNGHCRHDVGISKRVWEWIESYDNNNLQVLCASCNKIKGDRD